MPGSANRPAQIGCGASQLERTFQLSLAQRQKGGAFQYSRNAAPVPQAEEDFQSFPACCMCRQIVSLRTGNVGQVCEGPPRTPQVSGFEERGKSTLIKFSSGGRVTLCAC